MDKKSTATLALLVMLTVASVGLTFYKTVIIQDFIVVNSEPSTDTETVESGADE